MTAPAPSSPQACEPASPVDRRGRRVYVWWAIALTLLLAAGAFCWAVVVPVWRTKVEVCSFKANVLAWNPIGGPEGDRAYKDWNLRWAKAAVKNLGGPREAERQLRFYAKLPSWLAPEQGSATELIGYCRDVERAR